MCGMKLVLEIKWGSVCKENSDGNLSKKVIVSERVKKYNVKIKRHKKERISGGGYD